MTNNKLTGEQLTQIYATAREARLPVVWTEKKAMAHFKERVTPEIVELMAAELQERRKADQAVVFIDGDISSADIDKITEFLRESPSPVFIPGQSSALRDVTAERQRQIMSEGWTLDHDDEHTEGQMSEAAACYAMFANDQGFSLPAHWPWAREWWKQSGQRRDLVKAGALILAEIERLDRQEQAAHEQ